MPDAGENGANDGKLFPSDLSKSTAIKKPAGDFTYLDLAQFHEYFAADLRVGRRTAAQGLAAAEQKLNQAKAALSTLQTLLAQRPGAVAAVKFAELELSYCKVKAPFTGRVVNLNISAGAYASVGIPVFSLLDTRKWYVVANFREAEVQHMAPGSEAIVYLSSAPNQRFRGRVQGIGWAVKPEGELDLPAAGVPYVKRELNWVRVAQRFPVRIEVENPDVDLFRMGASAVAIIKGPPQK